LAARNEFLSDTGNLLKRVRDEAGRASTCFSTFIVPAAEFIRSATPVGARGWMAGAERSGPSGMGRLERAARNEFLSDTRNPLKRVRDEADRASTCFSTFIVPAAEFIRSASPVGDHSQEYRVMIAAHLRPGATNAILENVLSPCLGYPRSSPSDLVRSRTGSLCLPDQKGLRVRRLRLCHQWLGRSCPSDCFDPAPSFGR
jgi:hypothetical protein